MTAPASRLHPRRRLRSTTIVVGLALAIVAAACSSDDDTAAPASTTVPASTTTVPAATSTTAPAATGSIAEDVDIGGGRTIYVECHGEGSPTVLLMSGGGTASDLWHAPDQDPKVFDAIGAQTRVCAWDRPGVQYLDGSPSRSTPVAQPTLPQQGADDLQVMLDALDMHGPYVLAAHSFAGNIARVFAAEHPADVKGIVFVDVLSPELRAQMTPDEWRIWVAGNNRTPAQIASYPDMEQYDFDASLDQVDAAGPLDPMPVVVLTASVKFAELIPQYIDEGLLSADNVPRDFGVVVDRTNTAAQTELAGYFPGSEHIADTAAGHNIMIDNAPIVITAIEDVLAAVRAGRTTLTGGADHLAAAIEVDGRKLFLECRGTGSATVVLQSGFGNAGDIWGLTDTASPAVVPALAETNRVCTYDRPGSMITTTNASGTLTLGEQARPGRSGSAPMPRDPAEVVTELHDLLAAADVPGPYVLVGHSLGGPFDLLYARTYPDEVAALVLIDSPLPPLPGLVGAELYDKVRLFSLDPSLVPGYELESYDGLTLFDEIDAAGALRDIPVVVIRRGSALLDNGPIPEGLPVTQADLDALNQAQWDAQEQWAASVPGAEVITVPDTTHYIQSQRPDVVVDAIRAAIARI